MEAGGVCAASAVPAHPGAPTASTNIHSPQPCPGSHPTAALQPWGLCSIEERCLKSGSITINPSKDSLLSKKCPLGC